jgi:uracil-DNA glycosylase
LILGFGGLGAAVDDNFEAKVRGYTASVARSYMASIDLPSNYRFFSGTAVLPLPPIQVRHDKVFILGAYPSAIFQSIRKRRVPVDNLKMPFDATVYPGGVNASAEELDESYLKPLGLSRNDCWITNLVKVFLFKKEHAEQFRVLGSTYSAYATREEYERYAKGGLAWIDRELEIAEPRLIITLGSEVAGIIADVGDAGKREKLLNPYKVRTIRRGNHEYRVIHMVHPGQLMRRTPKWTKIHQKGIESLRPVIHRLLEETP